VLLFDERESVELVRTIEIVLQIIQSSLKSLREMLLYYYYYYYIITIIM
jgi:hypothetical protein